MNGTTAPAVVHDLARAVRDAGGRALIVGGWVRDAILADGAPEGSDVDMEVFGIPHDRLPALLTPFGRVEAVGAQLSRLQAARP